MIVFITLSEGSKWHKVDCSIYNIIKCLLFGEMKGKDMKYRSPAALKLSKNSRVVFDFILKRLGHGLIRVDKKYEH